MLELENSIVLYVATSDTVRSPVTFKRFPSNVRLDSATPEFGSPVTAVIILSSALLEIVSKPGPCAPVFP